MADESKRKSFFACCRQYHEALKPSQGWLVGPSWASGCSWKIAPSHSYKLLPVGNIVLSAADGLHKHHMAQWSLEQKERFHNQKGKVPLELGLRNEFTQDMTPVYALRLLAFFRMAAKSEDVKNAGFHIYFDWHRGINWQLNMCLPVCEVNLDVDPKPGERYPADWEQAFHAVAQTIPIHVNVIQGLLDKTPPDDLVCTWEVWRDLLGWYYTNKEGVDRRGDYQQLSEEVGKLVDKTISDLNFKALPKELDFLQDTGDIPISSVRKHATSNEEAFKQWLQQKVRNGRIVKSTVQNYLSALNILQQALQGELDLGVKSVFLLKTAQDVQKFLDNLKGSAWYNEKAKRRTGAARGGTDISAVLKQYGEFLNNQENANMTNNIGGEKEATTKSQPMKQEELTMTLETLLGRQDRNELLTHSKPLYLNCKWGELGSDSWRALYNTVWEKAWAEKRGEIISHGTLVTSKAEDRFWQNPKPYFSLDNEYAVYNNYGVRNLVPRLSKLFVACGIALEDVKVRFVTNVETDSTTETDADLNTILYGPPGTGKTYHTVAYAVAICTGRPVAEVMAAAKDDYQSVESEYNVLVQEGRIAFAAFHQSYEYGDFIEGIRPEEKGGVVTYSVDPGVFRKFCDEAGDEPCVFIIDEINRGNISKILGELITLIEPSKRETQHVTLPLSGDDFTVPKNVYILGTMNTADRSIAMMDTALRRRFDFVQMAPQPNLLPHDVQGVDVAKALEVMNERIEWLYDADHAIGHALFWTLLDEGKCTLPELECIFRKKIIPLLEEYFHDDYRKVQLVLGKSPMIERIDKPSNGLFPGADEIDLPEAIYRVAEAQAVWENPNTYKKIYQEVTELHAQG